MITLSQASNNDLSINSNGLLATVSNKEAYATIIGAAVRTVRGELQFDTGKGIPYFDTVLKTFGGIAQWKNAVRNVVNSYDFVSIIDSFDVNVVGSMIQYRMTISTDAGSIIVES